MQQVRVAFLLRGEVPERVPLPRLHGALHAQPVAPADHIAEPAGQGGGADLRRALKLEVQVRLRRATGAAAEPEDVASAHGLPLGHLDGACRQVRHHGIQTRSVPEDHEVAPALRHVHLAHGALRDVRADLHHGPCGRREHGQAVAVEVGGSLSLAAEERAVLAGHLQIESMAPVALVRERAVHGLRANPRPPAKGSRNVTG